MRMFLAPTVVNRYPDSTDCVDGKTLITGDVMSRKMRAQSRLAERRPEGNDITGAARTSG
jgi:hypothetical protein